MKQKSTTNFYVNSMMLANIIDTKSNHPHMRIALQLKASQSQVEDEEEEGKKKQFYDVCKSVNEKKE